MAAINDTHSMNECTKTDTSNTSLKPEISSAVLKRLVEEVRRKPNGAGGWYDRIHNRHARS